MSIEDKSKLVANIIKKEVSVLGYPVVLEIAETGKVPIIDRLVDPLHYKGPEEFDAVINFSDLFVQEGMMATKVSDKSKWSETNPPPDGIRILEFESVPVRAAVRRISGIAQNDFYKDRDECFRYYSLSKVVYEQIAVTSSLDRFSSAFLGLIRAGVVAGDMLDIPFYKQSLIQTKRLPVEGATSGNISVGITIMKANDLTHDEWLIADPAGATYGSVIANVLYLDHLGYKPKRLGIWNVSASHKGSQFALLALREMGIDVEIASGGYSPGMNENYYLEVEEGVPSVRDAGEALNRFLPPQLQL